MISETVELTNIERGSFMMKASNAFKDLRKQIVKHVEKHGESARATLTLKVTLSYDKAKEAYFVVSDIDSKPPKVPTRASSCMFDYDTKGEPDLFCFKGGTLPGNPRQSEIVDETEEPIRGN